MIGQTPLNVYDLEYPIFITISWLLAYGLNPLQNFQSFLERGSYFVTNLIGTNHTVK